MMANQERLELVLQATDKASAQMQAVRKEIELLRGAGAGGAKSTLDAARNTEQLGANAKRGAVAMSQIAFAAESATLGTRGVVMATSQLAQTAALSSVRFAAWHPYILLATVAIGTMLAIAKDVDETLKPSERTLERIKRMNLSEARQEVRRLRDVVEEVDRTALRLAERTIGEMLTTALRNAFSFDVDPSDGLLAQWRAARKARQNQFQTRADLGGAEDALRDRERTERARLATQIEQARRAETANRAEIAAATTRLGVARQTVSTIEAEVAAANRAKNAQDEQARSMFRRRDEQGRMIPLTNAEIAARNRLLAQNRELLGLTIAIANAGNAQRMTQAGNAMASRLEEARDTVTIQSAFERRRNSILRTYADEITALRAAGFEDAFRLDLQKRAAQIRDANLTLLEREIALTDRRTRIGVAEGSDDVRVQFQTRMGMIQIETEELRKQGVSEETIRISTEFRIRQLRRETARQAMADSKTLTGVLIDSSSKQVRAIGHAGETIRRVIIGAQAAQSAQKALHAAGEALSSLGKGDFRGAAIHGAASLKYAAAAALGARESLGGGAGAGGGGGGGGATEASRFEPRAGPAGAGSGVTINLITRDPYGRESIQQTLYSLERAGVLKTPGIQIPPTNGLVAA